MSFNIPYTKCPICKRQEKYVLIGTRDSVQIMTCKYNCTGRKPNNG